MRARDRIKQIGVLCFAALCIWSLPVCAEAASTVEDAPMKTTSLRAASSEPTAESVPVTLYAMGEEGYLEARSVPIAGASPLLILRALADAGTIPNVGFDDAFFEVSEGTVAVRGGKIFTRAVRCELPPAFRDVLKKLKTSEQRIALQCLADTFIDCYNAGAFVLTFHGAELKRAHHVDYENAFLYKQHTIVKGLYAETREAAERREAGIRWKLTVRAEGIGRRTGEPIDETTVYTIGPGSQIFVRSGGYTLEIKTRYAANDYLIVLFKPGAYLADHGRVDTAFRWGRGMLLPDTESVWAHPASDKTMRYFLTISR